MLNPKVRSVRVPVALLGTASLIFAGVLPQAAAQTQGPLNADDLPVGDHSEELSAGDFTVKATGSNEVTVSEHDRQSETGVEFTQRLQLNGAGSAEERSIRFDAKAGETVTVHAQSGGGSEDRALALYDETWGSLAEVPAYRGNSGNTLPAQEFQIEEDGTYWIASPSSGVNVYALELGDSDDSPENTPWDGVEAPLIEDITTTDEDPRQIEVTYAGLVGGEGGDLARAHLVDESGDIVDEQLWVSPGESGTIALTPPASGNYEVQVQLERHN